MTNDILGASVLSSCQACTRANATFNKPHPTLHSIPVEGLFNHWNMDLYGPLPTSDIGTKRVMVCIKSLIKHFKAIPQRTKEATEVGDALLTHVISRF